MVSVNTLVKKILDVKDIIVEDVELYEDEEGVKHLKVMARVYKRADDRCPKCGHKYITVIVNHANNSVVWVSDGFGKEVLREFFEKMMTEQRSSIEIVTADGARWISDLVEEYLPNATMCVDSFHVVQ